MQTKPLVYHAMTRLAHMTDMFCDKHEDVRVSVASEKTTLTIPNHGLSRAEESGISILQSDVPLNVISAVIDGDEYLVVELDAVHDYRNPPAGVEPKKVTVRLAAFSNGALNGSFEIHDAPSPRILRLIIPDGLAVGALTGNEQLFEARDFALNGWHSAMVKDSATLEIETPSTLTGSFETLATVAINLRVAAALNIDEIAADHLNAKDRRLDAAWMFIMPPGVVRTSRKKGARSDANAEIGSGQDHRTTLIDGFNVFVVLPVSRDYSATRAIDAAQGPIFAAVMRTFNGLRLPSHEGLCAADDLVANFNSHQPEFRNGAFYGHGYQFDAVYQIAPDSSIQPVDWTDMPEEIGNSLSRVGDVAGDVIVTADIQSRP